MPDRSSGSAGKPILALVVLALVGLLAYAAVVGTSGDEVAVEPAISSACPNRFLGDVRNGGTVQTGTGPSDNWNNTFLTQGSVVYSVHESFTAEQVAAIDRAIEKWQVVTQTLDFTRSELDTATLSDGEHSFANLISPDGAAELEAGAAGKGGYAFGGDSGSDAWTLQVRLDMDDTPTLANIGDFELIVLHEFGHALALGHSRVGAPEASIMDSILAAGTPPVLQAEDIACVQHLYGVPCAVADAAVVALASTDGLNDECCAAASTAVDTNGDDRNDACTVVGAN